MGPEAALHRLAAQAQAGPSGAAAEGNHSDRGTIPWTVSQEQPGKEEDSYEWKVSSVWHEN